MSRLTLPLVFLIVSLVLQIHPIRRVLFPSQELHPYFDAALIFFFIFLLIRLVDGFLLGWHAHRHREFPLPRVLHSLILAVFYLSILFVILNGILGIDITPFLATSAILTMILGLAFQGVLSNILAGMSLHFTKSFSKNDWIQVGDHEGMVLDTNWRETRIFDRYSNVIVLPNNIVASEKITNFSHPDKKTALTIPVKVSYDAPPSDVLAALLAAAKDVPEVLESPAPEAYVLSYDDFGISYVLKFWIKHFARKYPIMTDVGTLIWYKFKRQNIEIPVPVSDKLGEMIQSFGPKDFISGVPIEVDRNFHDLMRSSFLRYQEGEKKGELLVPVEEIRTFASFLVRHRYAPGEQIFKQGEGGESCFILASGRIKGEIAYEEKGKRYKSEFSVEPGGIFGEMSLFTGMPRTATGIVDVESELLEINTAGFSRLLESNPELADVIADLVSKRNKKNQEFLEKIKELSAQDIEISTNKHSILNRLKKFIKRF
ncbi:MAG: mechanosensitive ion channel [Candidatus Aminicenantes bacterium]|nr:MAG: mechanosensitive ion channel [Candidatus Aminicenantes bacterium]